METNFQEVKHHLMETDEKFSRWVSDHTHCEQKLNGLSQLAHLTENEQLEEINLKKRKLSLKDQMERKIQMYVASESSVR
jgi:uncharacterized protein YdcH (DUF465 family)